MATHSSILASWTEAPEESDSTEGLALSSLSGPTLVHPGMHPGR